MVIIIVYYQLHYLHKKEQHQIVLLVNWKEQKEESTITAQVKISQEQLNVDSNSLKAIEGQLALEENRVSASLRALADQREGTARQEGHINGLRSRIDATTGEINRLTTVRDLVQDRLKVM